jgi:hypothetical protein
LGKKKISGTIAWIATATFLNCHRPPLNESQAELAPSTPRQLLELTESREGDAGDIRISIDSYKYNSTFPPSLAPRLPGMKKRKNMVLGAIS